MRRKIFALLGAFALLSAITLVSCQQTVAGGEVTTYTNYQGYVRDAANVGIADVTISWLAADGLDQDIVTKAARSLETVTTDEKGYYSFSVATGSVFVFFEPKAKEDNTMAYAAYGATFNPTDDKTNATTVRVVQNDVTLPAFTGTITGTLLENVSGGGAATPIASKKCAIDLGNYYVPTYVDTAESNAEQPFTFSNKAYATTDAAGKFSFTSLPLQSYAGANITFQTTNGANVVTYTGNLPNEAILGVKDGFDYGATYGVIAPIFVNSTVNSSLSIVTGGTIGVATNAAITLQFKNDNQKEFALIATDAVKAKNVLTQGGKKVDGTVAISGSTITITPAKALDANSTYSFAYYATDGSSTLTGNVTVNTGFADTAVTAPAITLIATARNFSDNVNFTMSYDAAYTYKAYWRVKGDDQWNEVNPGLGTVSSTAVVTANIAADGSWKSGVTYEVKARATLASGVNSIFADSNVIEAKDTKAPTVAPTIGGWNGTAWGATTAITRTVQVNLAGSELMSLPVLGTPTSSSVTAAVELSADKTYAIITIYAAAGVNASGSTIPVKYFDAAGNQYDANPATLTAAEALDLTL
jgi:hypothetical protein